MKKVNRNIFVTKPYLPPLTEYVENLKTIWKTNQLTNDGILVQKFENQLKKLLGVKYLFFVSNGTIALQLAIKALDIKKEIITTPFSYVATTNSILWEGCKPVFVDIDPHNFCIDLGKIEKAITKATQAIMAVHVYGNPCNVIEIERIAKKHNIKVIYDAAHAFGTKVKGKSVLNYGDISTLSFHATKLFHTGEGGAIITNDAKLAKKIELLRSFGHINDDYISVGINARNSEFHAAMGLALISKASKLIEKRKTLSKKYDDLLLQYPIMRPVIKKDVSYNFAYYPILFETEDALLRAKENLEKNKIFPRRYFYPSLNELSYVLGNICPVSEAVSRRILCLPLYYDLSEDEVEFIASIIKKTFYKPKVKLKVYPYSALNTFILKSGVSKISQFKR